MSSRCNKIRLIACGWALFSVPAAAERLEVSGGTPEQEANVRAFVELANETCAAPRWRVRRRFNSADDQVQAALEAYGFYSATIEKSLVWGEDCWTAQIAINPGTPVSVRKLEIEVTGGGSADAAFADAVADSDLQVGEVLRHAAYKRTKQRLQAVASDRGYFSADFTAAEIDVWADDEAADIVLSFDSGDRYRFGEVALNQDFLDADFVRRFVTLERGEAYESAALARLQQDLNSSGYFGRVDVRPEFSDNPDNEVPINVNLAPGSRIAYSVGAGFSTDTGPRFRSGYENKRVNRRGHQFSGDLLLSEVLSELSATYRRPLRDPTTEWLSYSAGVQSENTDTSESDRFSLGVKRATKTSGDWIRTEALSLEFERFLVGLERDESRLLMPSIGFSKKRADMPINPERGHRLNAELRGASDSLGSTTSFLQLIGYAKFVSPLGTGGRLLLRAEAGTTIKDEFRELPPSVRFFAGGIDTVRGYGFETIGPTDVTGRVIGGSHLLVASAEYDRLFYRNFAFAAFVDAGNAFDGTNVEARIGAGLGLKWRSPIGPVRVYLAHPVNFSDRSVRLHISIGPDL